MWSADNFVVAHALGGCSCVFSGLIVTLCYISHFIQAVFVGQLQMVHSTCAFSACIFSEYWLGNYGAWCWLCRGLTPIYRVARVVLSAHERILASFGCEVSDWWVRQKSRPCWIFLTCDWWKRLGSKVQFGFMWVFTC